MICQCFVLLCIVCFENENPNISLEMVFFLVPSLSNISVFDLNTKGVGRIGKVLFSSEDFGRGFLSDPDWVSRACTL